MGNVRDYLRRQSWTFVNEEYESKEFVLGVGKKETENLDLRLVSGHLVV